MIRRRALLAVTIAFAFSACGAPTTVRSMATAGAVTMPVLSASAIPGLTFRTKTLTPGELAKDAPIPALADKIAAWGYIDGRERTFQGESRHLTLVVSRALVFKDAQGARGFVALVHQESSAFFGSGVTQQALTAQGRAGWLFTPAACACHMASPVLVGVVSSGSGVAWLEINGPAATPDLLMRLLDPAQSVPPTD